jgi:hypothetical protein
MDAAHLAITKILPLSQSFKNNTAAVTDTFRLSTVPSIGSLIGVTQESCQAADNPVASRPKTTAHGCR